MLVFMRIGSITHGELTKTYAFAHKILADMGALRSLEFYKWELSKHPQLLLQAIESDQLIGTFSAV